jgi:membrane-associated phospholipid phosphatase
MSVSTRIDRTNLGRNRTPRESPKSDSAAPQQGSTKLARYALPVTLAILGCAALAIDVPVARWCKWQNVPSLVKKTCDLTEGFGHAAGVALILFAAWVLAPQQRRGLLRVICCAYLSGIVADVMKLLLARGRPYKTDLSAVHNVWGTFQGWLPMFGGSSASQSFTSAHTATAVGLALGLGWLFPRGKWMFIGFALLVAMQRIAGPYHFVSDTLWGAAVGALVAFALLPGGAFSRPFDRLEHRLATV